MDTLKSWPQQKIQMESFYIHRAGLPRAGSMEELWGCRQVCMQEQHLHLLHVFGIFVLCPDARTVVPQREAVALNSLHCHCHRPPLPVWQADSRSAVDGGDMLLVGWYMQLVNMILQWHLLPTACSVDQVSHSLPAGTRAPSFPLTRIMYCYWEAGADLELAGQTGGGGGGDEGDKVSSVRLLSAVVFAPG